MPINDGRTDGPKTPHSPEQAEIARLKDELEQQRLLNNELQHRAKNALSVVQAIIASTLTEGASVTEARDVLSDRIAAMGRANALIGTAEWGPMQIDDTIRNAFSHLEQFEGRIEIGGPALTIGPKAAVALTMAFHELETNAIKYGALSDDAGSIKVVWEITEPGPSLRLIWIEHGGPPVTEPTRKGFGSRLINSATPRSLRGTTELCFLPTGVTWSLVAPVSAMQDGKASTSYSAPG